MFLSFYLFFFLDRYTRLQLEVEAEEKVAQIMWTSYSFLFKVIEEGIEYSLEASYIPSWYDDTMHLFVLFRFSYSPSLLCLYSRMVGFPSTNQIRSQSHQKLRMMSAHFLKIIRRNLSLVHIKKEVAELDLQEVCIPSFCLIFSTPPDTNWLTFFPA